MNKIIFNGNTIEVTGCYPYRYPDGKEVLRITTVTSDYNILKLLNKFTGVIQYFEDEVLKTEYENYSADFSCNFYKDEWSVEMKRVGATEVQLQETRLDLEATSAALEELIFIVMEGSQ